MTTSLMSSSFLTVSTLEMQIFGILPLDSMFFIFSKCAKVLTGNIPSNGAPKQSPIKDPIIQPRNLLIGIAILTTILHRFIDYHRCHVELQNVISSIQRNNIAHA